MGRPVRQGAEPPVPDFGTLHLDFAGGYELSVLSDAQVAPWPAWLLAELQPPSAPPLQHVTTPSGDADKARLYVIGALRHAVERVATAPEGVCNDTLNAECWSMAWFIPVRLPRARVQCSGPLPVDKL
jgi:hypothetical protein